MQQLLIFNTERSQKFGGDKEGAHPEQASLVKVEAEAADAQVLQRKAELERARLNLSNTILRSPVTGIVGRRHAEARIIGEIRSEGAVAPVSSSTESIACRRRANPGDVARLPTFEAALLLRGSTRTGSQRRFCRRDKESV